MMQVDETLEAWSATLMTSIPVGGLISRNPIVYKWKSTFRVWMLREVVAWRLVDLLQQSQVLYHQSHILGARILLRSAFETLATLIYLNQQMRRVIEGTLDFNAFGEKTSVLLLGARNNPDAPKSMNIVSVLEKCDNEYPGLMAFYADLSESAHPSYEGFMRGYSKVDHGEYETHFSNNWSERYTDGHLERVALCMTTFDHEYNEVWPDRMARLERWIEENDEALANSRVEDGR
ncbi:hypothetical protein [Devosia salina]|uniref:Uncharacterized protein n=1 Tax=Devosia salina TaxID=2860336 RepID=A0ABX8WFD6_9HYPH|nr:hypothetical protein [Devosia salina]QYO76711.1 hypothetical protein K1X15_19395 [Devosia salina]